MARSLKKGPYVALQLEKKGRIKCKVYSTGEIRISCYFMWSGERQDKGS